MKNKVDLLEERLASIHNILGDFDDHDVNRNTVKISHKMRTISDIIMVLQKEIADNDSITFKEVYKKCNHIY
jgi:hypothetical protein